MAGHSRPMVPVRVLLVEPRSNAAAALRERLARRGYVVTFASTREEALDAVVRDQPDVVLVDAALKDAITPLETVQRLQGARRAPVILLESPAALAAPGVAVAMDARLPVDEQELAFAIQLSIHTRRLDEKLSRSERLCAVSLNAVSDGVVVTGPDGQVMAMNTVAEAVTKWRAEDAAGQPITNVVSLLDEQSKAPLRDEPVMRALASGQPIWNVSGAAVRALDGTLTPVDLNVVPLVSESRDLEGAVVAFRDVRASRVAEDALRRIEGELRHAHKMESVGRLAGGVAHDFNNLLTLVSGDTEILLESEALPQELRPLVAEIQDAGARAAALTRQLLAFSRKQTMVLSVVDVNALIKKELSLLGRLIGEDIAIVTTLDPHVPTVRLDIGQMEQVLMNLAVNARDAMPDGGTLTLATRRADVTPDSPDKRTELKDGAYAVVTVSDTGVGIDDAVVARVFEPFFTTKEMGRGTGLGLATVYGIVKQSNGYIYVSSVRDQGTSFQIYLPAVDEAPAARQVDEAHRSTHGHETILLVEDDTVLRQRTASALRARGYEVLDASSGEHALTLSDQHVGPIHILATDVVMPGMGGRELARQIKERRPTARVLFMSGYADDVMVRSGVPVGEAFFLQKPFTPHSLAAKLRELLST